MAFDFPASPSNGQQYAPAGGPLYTYDGTKWKTGSAAAAGSDYGGFLNKIRNGTMDVWQRGSPVSCPTTGAYAADGWLIVPTGAAVSASLGSNSSAGTLSKNCLSITGATSVTGLIVYQRIEGLVAAPLAGKTVTFQAKIFNNTGGTITPTITGLLAGAADNWASPTADLATTNLQACPNGAWTKVAYTFNVSGNAALGYAIALNFGNNFSTSGKSASIAEADLRVTPGVMLGLNANPPTPEMRPVATEQAFCERYFRWLGFNIYFYAGIAGIASGCSVIFPTMRAVPTVGANVVDPNTGQIALNQSGNAWQYVTPYSALALITATAVGVSQLSGYRAPASAEL